METKSIERIQLLHPKIREAALAAYQEAVNNTPNNVHPMITQGLRTFAESNSLYAQGRTTLGNIVTKAKAGQSYHNYGLALDFCLMIDGKVSWVIDNNWMKVVNIFKKHGFAWGGDFKSFKDAPHLELRFDYHWRVLYSKYTENDFIIDTKYVNI